MENKTEFKPYIPASKITPEITVTSVIIGVLLSVIFYEKYLKTPFTLPMILTSLTMIGLMDWFSGCSLI